MLSTTSGFSRDDRDYVAIEKEDRAMTVETWQHFLSPIRIGTLEDFPAEQEESQRSNFERDWDRVLFSNAFRRMHDKTQVFPLPGDDVVHSRLTHSLEASSVGRSLGRAVGNAIAERHHEPPIRPETFSGIVATACLAHDIGNPPFGHAGEDAIREFFREYFRTRAASSISQLRAPEKADLEDFEGNAQGFRILTRLQLEEDRGLCLTAATLGAYTKYPREAGIQLVIPEHSSTKKHGFVQGDKRTFQRLVNVLELKRHECQGQGLSFYRHPLAFLVEAADDICYSILDIEDGIRLDYVRYEEAEAAIMPIVERGKAFSCSRLKRFCRRERFGYLRALAIGELISECAVLFADCEDAILNGTWDMQLVDGIRSSAQLESLTGLAQKYCYQAPQVLEIELAGYKAISGLLECFVEAALAGAEPPRQTQKAWALLKSMSPIRQESSVYERLLRVTDFVCGMTDRFALSLWRRLTGVSVPGRMSF